jgi:metacaspase-1
MAKRALCVGINDYPLTEDGENIDLRGCVNDAKDWADLLVDRYDFARSDVKLVTDKRATKAAMIRGLKALLTGARAGDVLVFTNSSHGSYTADLDGDEGNYNDEMICPYDIVEGNGLIDDELRELFATMADGVQLTVIADSCHSGTVTRLFTPTYRRRRFVNPKVLGMPSIEGRSPAQNRKWQKKQRERYPQSGMKEILLSGCEAGQTSLDMAMEDGTIHGAMTYAALAAIRAANYRLTYRQLHAALAPWFEAREISDQTPQLEGTRANKDRQIFV